MIRPQPGISPVSIPSGTTELAKNILAVEKTIKNNVTESAHIFDPKTGVKVFEKQGDANSIRFLTSELAPFKGHIFTHNHPRDSSFSGNDLNLSINRDFKEIRAVGKNNKHSVIWDLENKPKVAKLKSEYKASWKDTERKLNLELGAKTIDMDTANANFHHLTLNDLFKRFPKWGVYKREKWDK